MICPECKAQGLRSTVHSGGGSITLMGFSPYWDEDGVYHSHDPNQVSVSYHCSGGHSWGESKLRACPAPGCDYGED